MVLHINNAIGIIGVIIVSSYSPVRSTRGNNKVGGLVDLGTIDDIASSNFYNL